MTNLENENKKQSNTFIEEKGTFLDQQRQQIENTTSTISDTTNKVTNNVNQYQQTNREILDKNIDIYSHVRLFCGRFQILTF